MRFITVIMSTRNVPLNQSRITIDCDIDRELWSIDCGGELYYI